MIKFKTKDLQQAFKELSPAIDQNPILPIIKYVKCVCEGNTATLRASNLKLDIILTTPVESENLTLLLPFHQVASQLPTFQDEDVTFTIEALQVKMKCGIKNHSFTTQPENNYPVLTPTGEMHSMNVGEDYVLTMKEALRHRSINEQNVSFYGICLSGKDVVSTDSGQAYLRTLSYDINGTYHVQPLFVEALQNSPAIIEVNERFISAKQGNKTTRCTLFEQQYINYKFFIPKDPVWNVQVNASELLNNIESIVAYGDKMAECVLGFKDKMLSVNYENPLEANSFYAEIECYHSVAIPEISFIANTLKSILKDSGEMLSLAITAIDKPMYISSEKEGILNFIMPSVKKY